MLHGGLVASPPWMAMRGRHPTSASIGYRKMKTKISEFVPIRRPAPLPSPLSSPCHP